MAVRGLEPFLDVGPAVRVLVVVAARTPEPLIIHYNSIPERLGRYVVLGATAVVEFIQVHGDHVHAEPRGIEPEVLSGNSLGQACGSHGSRLGYDQ